MPTAFLGRCLLHSTQAPIVCGSVCHLLSPAWMAPSPCMFFDNLYWASWPFGALLIHWTQSLIPSSPHSVSDTLLQGVLPQCRTSLRCLGSDTSCCATLLCVENLLTLCALIFCFGQLPLQIPSSSCLGSYSLFFFSLWLHGE